MTITNDVCDLTGMSAIGTKQTSAGALQMSAFGVKRTWRFALQMSAFDPKRTLSLTQLYAQGHLCRGLRLVYQCCTQGKVRGAGT